MSDQSHHGPLRCALLVERARRQRARARAAPSTISSSSSGCSRAMRRMPPHASCAARSIRQRSSGCVATGISDASWPQYSNSRRGAYQASLSSASRSYGPEPREQRQVVRALEHVDRVDLQQPEPLDRGAGSRAA